MSFNFLNSRVPLCLDAHSFFSCSFFQESEKENAKPAKVSEKIGDHLWKTEQFWS